MNIQHFLPAQLPFFILLSLMIKECGSKRGGILTGGRGISAGRSGGLFGGFRRSGGGGLFGGLSGSRTRGSVFGSTKSGYPHDSKWGTYRGSNIGRTSGGLWNSGSRKISGGRPRGRGL